MINILGDAPTIRRLETGLWSFDRSFENAKGEIGFPLGKGLEIFGETHCGKSTIVYGLAGIVAKHQEKNIALADLEGFDPDFLISVLDNAGFSGDVQYIHKGSDEDILDDLSAFIKENIYGVGILDSIAAISPLSEQKGKHGEANWGRRGVLMAQFCRKSIKTIRDEGDNAPTIFMINHAYPRMGGMGKISPGGEVKRFLASMTIAVRRVYYKDKYAEYPDGSYVIEGKVTKNRWGFKDRIFWLFVLAGKGIHKGLTALYDGYRLDLVDINRNVVSIGDTSYGRLGNITKKAQAGDDEFFDPFFEVLKNYEKNE